MAEGKVVDENKIATTQFSLKDSWGMDTTKITNPGIISRIYRENRGNLITGIGNINYIEDAYIQDGLSKPLIEPFAIT